MKPLLIINCSDSKLNKTSRAIDLYQGSVYTTLRANVPGDILANFDCLIISAKFGLVDGADPLPPYDLEMDPNHIDEFVQQHSRQARKLIKKHLLPRRRVYVFLTRKYLKAFDAICATKELQGMIKATAFYCSSNHCGNIQMMSRMKRVLTAECEKKTAEPILFRSGVANKDEVFGYLSSGAHIGSSLAYFNKSKTGVLPYIMDQLKAHRAVFVDNGVITAIKNGIFVSSDDVFRKYLDLVNCLPRKASQNLYGVIPDDPLELERSLAVVKKHRKDISLLMRKMKLILPIHKAGSLNALKVHAENLLKTLNWPEKLVLGVPCKEQANINGELHNLRLSMEEIECLLSLKSPRTGKPLFSRVHFLALSDATKGSAMPQRVMLANMYNVDITMDCVRTTAIFSSDKGKSLVATHKDVLTFDAARKDPNHQHHEANATLDSQKLHDLAVEYIETNVSSFIARWNNVAPVCWALSEDGTEDELIEMCTNLLYEWPRLIEDELDGYLKDICPPLFFKSKHVPSGTEVRAGTLVNLFEHNTFSTGRTSLQLQMF